MPWKAADAERHMHAAKGHGDQWSAVANSVLSSTGDEGRAIREANATVGRTIRRRKLATTMLKRS